MIQNPFITLKPWNDRIAVAILRKEDGLITDQSAASAMDTADYATIKQVHGAGVQVITAPSHRETEADAQVTACKGIALGIRIADCQPILIWAPDAGVVGLIHAGWKGLLAGVIPATFDTLRKNWGIRGEDTYVCVGPCLCRTCADFSDPVRELPGIPKACLSESTADLRRWADIQCMTCGVTSDRIERMADCTRCHPELYWTYRGGDREDVRNGKNNMMVCCMR